MAEPVVDAVELFAGAGGAALGMRRAGVRSLAAIERDPEAVATLVAAGFPGICGDVEDLSLVEGLAPDLIWSSWPCQDWSSSGRQLGTRGDRNGWPATANHLDFLGPRWFVGENVVGLTMHDGQCLPDCLGPEDCPVAYLDRVILADLRRLFDWADYRILDAVDHGVPQHRQRLIVVAGPAPGIAWPKPTHGRATSQNDLFGRELMTWKTLQDRSWDRLTRCACCEDWLCLVCQDHAGGCVCPPPSEWPEVPSFAVTSADCQGLGSRRVRDAWERITGRRSLSRAEALAAQDFPPDYPVNASSTPSWWRQIGNAVPPALARVVVEAVTAADASLRAD